jgi:predicted Zn-dependent protease
MATPPVQPALLAAYPLLDNPALQDYVNGVGKRLVPGWRYGVIGQAESATHFLDGAVYVSRDLLGRLNSEAELAAVLAREIAHTVGQHTRTNRPLPPGLDALLGTTPDFEPFPKPMYSVDDLRDADARAAQMLARAGYEPRALLVVSGRSDEIRKRVVELARRSVEGEFRVARDAFLDQLDGLPFGDPPELGSLVGNTLRHGDLGLAMSFPPGWLVVREPGRVVARAPSGDALIELMTLAQPQPAQSPTGSLESVLQSALALAPGARFDDGAINGLPAAFAVGTINAHPVLASALKHQDKVIVVAVQSRDNETYLRDRALLRGALNSVRPLTPAERPPLRTLNLRVATIEAGKQFAALAAASPLGENAAAQLRALNGLGPRAEPRAGMRLKLVD